MSSRSRRAKLQNSLPRAIAGAEGEGAAPFRILGAVAVQALLARPSAGGFRAEEPHAEQTRAEETGAASPSGLLSREAWEDELIGLYGDIPDWYGSDAERERQFARWVQAEAKTLATRLDRLAGEGVESGLARQVSAVAAALWNDADWARRRLDGSLDD